MTHDISEALDRYSYSMRVNVSLLRAICTVETNCDNFKVRFEPTWKYAFSTAEYAKALGISEETERSLQSHSWGIMQVMGSVAREEGYAGPLQRLSELDLGLFFGCCKLQKLMLRYTEISDVIAGYNAGSAVRTTGGKYINQNYVDSVLALMK